MNRGRIPITYRLQVFAIGFGAGDGKSGQAQFFPNLSLIGCVNVFCMSGKAEF